MKKYIIDWAEEILVELLPNGSIKELYAKPYRELADYSEAQAEIERLKAEIEALKKANENIGKALVGALKNRQWRSDFENIPANTWVLVKFKDSMYMPRLIGSSKHFRFLDECDASYKLIEP